MSDPVLSVTRLGPPPWPTLDPFLFCVHHEDAYPAGDARMAPAASLSGRAIGQDFSGRDGWSMYHGEVVPGFPRHPHRGFETVSLVRAGFVDHADSLGATARIGPGDVQWMTAGRGIVHAEMFPLVHRDRPNPTGLFQLWLNLPARSKLARPSFVMAWAEQVPRVELPGAAAVVVAGDLFGARPPAPPPDSWASVPGARVAIATLNLAAGARLVLPAEEPGVNRQLYAFRGAVRVGGRAVSPPSAVRLGPGEVAVEAGPAEAELLLLQGRPIGEPVAQHGPFVMNTRDELVRAYDDYRRTGFGGWPWPDDAPAHPRERGRYARHADGREEGPPGI